MKVASYIRQWLKQEQRIRRFSLFVTIALLLSGCYQTEQKDQLSEIIEKGSITVGTLFGPNTYYIDAEGPAGFEYELAKKYAEHLGVKLEIVPSYNLEALFPKLESGDVDFLAAGLAVTPKRLEQFNFAPSYDSISQKLVFKQGKERPRDVEDLEGNLVVTALSSHVENLQKLKNQYPELSWQENSELDAQELLLEILAENIDYTVIDSNTLAINRRYYPEISIGFTIKQPEPLAWAVKKHGDHSLLTSLVEYFGEVHHDGTLLALDDKYYGHVSSFNYVDTRTFIKAIEETLPKYRPLFEKYGEEIDWRLLAAISYQESHWNPKARSYTGVRGMMMLTLPTARQMGVKSRLDAEQSIRGGAKYITQLIKRMPDRIPMPDKIWFALASYNVGFGHLNDARIITEQQGGDPDRWVEVKTRLPLLKQKKYYKKTKYGYARGDEPVNYVENIRRYYDTLQWFDEKQRMEELTSPAPVSQTTASLNP
ncbi:membrane-bound lytic murein transglycosylase MltF [Thalassotalea sp. LPB0316]|uniref:membrane-bound lytic murein transglycosylase MltF n=1 Tax=Thalassotalea sp. LPB0316 TaxID=2769490 RepID=UPI00186634A0|nr:membrane-bound lytic murein transglycosylase MltF [Thalassotalea sp. LPB0316]QOL25703.1 membrane-bound lytic murein transglycosylase MltF [Thalassotalea sp. LPB0316]